MLALEDQGLAPSSRAGANIHCAERTHPHKASGNTGSLQIKPSIRNGDGGCKVGGCTCHARCGWIPTFSEYVSRVGPPQATKDFWTKDKVASVVDSLKKKESFHLGWLEWKQAKGFPVDSAARDASEVIHKEGGKIGGDHGYAVARKFFVEDFKDGSEDARGDTNSPTAVALVAKERKWDEAVLFDLMNEGLLSIKWSKAYKGDVRMGFAYQGFYMSDNSYPARIIKTKHLRHKEEMSFKYGGEPTPVIADFTSPHTSVQEAKQVLFCEGEPDAISWRHLFPDDGIVMLGNQHQYSVLPELLPRVRLKGKDVIYAIDRDVHKDTGIPMAIADHMASHVRVLDAIRAQEPASVKVWMCPLLHEKSVKDSKDINDFLKVCRDKEKFLMAAVPVTTDPSISLNQSYGEAVRKVFARKQSGPSKELKT